MSAQPHIEMDLEEKKRSSVLGYPVKRDSRTGIYKEVVTEHTINEHGAAVPNSTMHGGSTAFSANDRIPYSVDPDYKDGYTFDPNQVQHGAAASPVPLPGTSAQDMVRMEMSKATPETMTAHESAGQQTPQHQEAPPVPEVLQRAEDMLDASNISPAVPTHPTLPTPHAEIPPMPQPQPQPVPQAQPAEAYLKAIGESALLDCMTTISELKAKLVSADNALKSQTEAKRAVPPDLMISKPTKRIVFDFGPPHGKMSAIYHNIIRDNDLLILEWDERFEDGNKYEPSNLGSETPINVIVGKEREEMRVISLGLSFISKNTCYIVLLIDRRHEQQQPPQPQESGMSDAIM